MKTVTRIVTDLRNILLLGAFSFASGVSLAQMQEPVAPPASEAQQTEVSEADLQKFAEIYVDVEQTRMSVAEEIQSGDEPVAAEEAQVRLEQELVATIEEHGWSVDKYNRVATAISNDPEMREKAVEIISRLVS